MGQNESSLARQQGRQGRQSTTESVPTVQLPLPPPPLPGNVNHQLPQLPWIPAPTLTVGWLRGLHWQTVPPHLIHKTHWSLGLPPDWQELTERDFHDIDRHFRSGQNTIQLPVNQAPQQHSVLNVRRTQNIEIMLSSLPGTVEDKAAIVLHVVRATLTASPNSLRNAILALEQMQLSAFRSGRDADADLDAFSGPEGQPPSAPAQVPPRDDDSRAINLLDLGADLLLSVLRAGACVRSSLRAAASCRR
eukprot:CAMPEP_0113702836 /NCGR_PEP_ID=MMETSP0038_2-20120614/25457_1 /TAXON_ID=2898 /ORGANISM="Cryptomonas paramecium" /LENGTH=247 /DNA_ID=CAMNT_0000627095 /DNA_START=61 /DNA_END=801 /DNA_ORIENTATION=+ /assembly_acc=CAM_ASM_000170